MKPKFYKIVTIFLLQSRQLDRRTISHSYPKIAVDFKSCYMTNIFAHWRKTLWNRWSNTEIDMYQLSFGCSIFEIFVGLFLDLSKIWVVYWRFLLKRQKKKESSINFDVDRTFTWNFQNCMRKCTIYQNFVEFPMRKLFT